jgi:hypothetical protein
MGGIRHAASRGGAGAAEPGPIGWLGAETPESAIGLAFPATILARADEVIE